MDIINNNKIMNVMYFFIDSMNAYTNNNDKSFFLFTSFMKLYLLQLFIQHEQNMFENKSIDVYLIIYVIPFSNSSTLRKNKFCCYN